MVFQSVPTLNNVGTVYNVNYFIFIAMFVLICVEVFLFVKSYSMLFMPNLKNKNRFWRMDITPVIVSVPI